MDGVSVGHSGAGDASDFSQRRRPLKILISYWHEADLGQPYSVPIVPMVNARRQKQHMQGDRDESTSFDIFRLDSSGLRHR